MSKQLRRDVKKKALQRKESMAELFRDLQNEEYVLEERLQTLLEEVIQVLREEFPALQDVSLAVIGSAGRGQWHLRKILFPGNDVISDLDCVALSPCGDEVKFGTYFLLRKRLDELLHQKSRELGFFDLQYLRSCKRYNLQAHQACPLRSVQEARNVLSDVIIYKNKIRSAPIFYHLAPSVPHQTNELSRSYLRSALEEIYWEDPESWKEIVALIFRTLRDDLFWVKNKHVDHDERFRRNTRVLDAFSEQFSLASSRKVLASIGVKEFPGDSERIR